MHFLVSSLCTSETKSSWLVPFSTHLLLSHKCYFKQAILLPLVFLAKAQLPFPSSSVSSWKVSPKRTVGFSPLLLVAHTIFASQNCYVPDFETEREVVCVCVCGWGLVFNSQTYRRANIQSSSSLHIVRPHTVTRSCTARCISKLL